MQQLHEAGKKFIENIKETYDSKGITDRGGAKDSLSYKVDGNRLIIEGKARIMFNQFGRRPGTPPPFGVIRDWVIRKLNPPKEAVYPITKTIVDKIAKQGTTVLRDNSKGLELEIIFSEIAEELQQEIIAAEQISITDGLIKTWKK